jgi:shikimate dehydrogenase
VRVILIGYRGTGKTTIGRALARELGVSFIDTDGMIEDRESKSISEIFRRKGEPHFRKIEKEVIQSLPRADAVISTGGGAVMDPENVEHLRAVSTVFLFIADPETIVKRIQKSSRPPLTELPLAEEVRHMLQIRTPFYLKAADYCVETDFAESSRVAQRIMRILAGEEIDDPKVQRLLGEISPLSPGDRRIIETKSWEGCPLRISAVIGDPVSHSKSPPLFNALYARYRLPHRYIRMSSPDAATLLELARARDFRGLSVTIPHKQAVMPHLDEVDPVAGKIGAVNTIVSCGGRLRGYNTDWLGIRRPVSHLRGGKAVVLGAGGAAAAAIYACRDLEMHLTVMNRTPERGVALAERFGCDTAPLTAFPQLEPDLVINATPVGMEPDTRSPLPIEWLRKEMTIFDLVYTPPYTPLLREAQERGCSTISGMQMFIHQAREQFHLFTGILPPESLVEEMIS